MENSLATILGGWLSAGLTIFLFSFLYKDNPLFKIAEHLYLGVGMGWWFIVLLYGTWIPKAYEPFMQGEYLLIIPVLLGLSLVTQFIPRISWVSRYGFTFIMGYGAGLVLPLNLATDFMAQIAGTIKPFSQLGSLGCGAIINAILIAIGAVCVLTYFYFSVEQKGIIKKASNVGIYFLMIYFGASFGNTVMARFSLLYGRFDMLYDFSGRSYAFGTPIIVLLTVGFFVLKHIMDKKKAEEQKNKASAQ